MLLKMLGENGRMDYSPEYLACTVAVNPPINLGLCSEALRRSDNRLYDRYFTKMLVPQVQERIETFTDAPRPDEDWAPKTLREFDKTYTSLVSGFKSLQDYYDRSSSAQFVESIKTPTFILTGRDDPLIPASSFEQLPSIPSVTGHIAEHGGHLGYIAGKTSDPDRRWMDWRVIDWLAKHLRFSTSHM